MCESLVEPLRQIGSLLRAVREIVEERVNDDKTPDWALARGWTEYLLSLPQHELELCEGQGAAARLLVLSGVPPSLRLLAERVQEALRWVPQPTIAIVESRVRRASPRKTQQLAKLLAVAAPLVARCERVVDVGSGSGSLASELLRLGKPVVGVERTAHQVRSASRRILAPGVVFQERDGVATGLGLQESDIAIGLHACGELGDVLITEAAAVGASVALVTCCVQKIRADVREPLSLVARSEGLRLPREVLGLANLQAQEQGVEVSLARTLEARQARCALRLLLRARGLSLRPGAEMQGINRRRALEGAALLVPAAFAARGLPLPTPQEQAQAEAEAAQVFARVRRFSLPRAMLGPVIELALVLDRACVLQEAGYNVRVLRLFDAQTSPRNLLILGESPLRTKPAH